MSSMPKPEPEPEPAPELRRPASPRPPQPLVEPEAAGATLWVGNIPDSLLQGSDGLKKTEAELRRVFFAHGVTTAVSVRKKPEGANKSWAFVSFATADGVRAALQRIPIHGPFGREFPCRVAKMVPFVTASRLDSRRIQMPQ